MYRLPDILALMIGIAGWYYLFHSRAASRLGHIEDPSVNLRRTRLRRINGFAMLLLAAFFYAGFTINDQDHAQAFVLIWLSVFLLLLLVVTLAVIDIRLTAKLRRKE